MSLAKTTSMKHHYTSNYLYPKNKLPQVNSPHSRDIKQIKYVYVSSQDEKVENFFNN